MRFGWTFNHSCNLSNFSIHASEGSRGGKISLVRLVWDITHPHSNSMHAAHTPLKGKLRSKKFETELSFILKPFSTTVRFKTPANTVDCEARALGFAVDVEQRPVEWAFSRKV